MVNTFWLDAFTNGTCISRLIGIGNSLCCTTNYKADIRQLAVPVTTDGFIGVIIALTTIMIMYMLLLIYEKWDKKNKK